ncbi:helix-turn-helix transcriptional regulator [Rubeoparvulum massiliense]|uniref:helix-turn-helix transcriptional regulator n=1 Tax=Rubeoparvulum massiliense TaxID=1631346 RepID=UPI00065E7966|nr:metalloregulator ArsR/SmtB family transcription factor [Rubeoparvulum massiliense]
MQVVDDKTGSTRDQIVLLLKREGSMSVGDLAKSLDITEMAVRRHLHTLERDMLIHSTLVRQAMGRPSHVYSLTEEAEAHFPNNYAELVVEILQDMEAVAGKEKVDRFFERREQRLHNEMQKVISTDLSLPQRVERLVQFQNERGYMAEWDQDADGRYIVRELHCPIADVARQFEKACHCELQLFTNVLQARVERTQCMALGTGEHCVYTVEEQ